MLVAQNIQDEDLNYAYMNVIPSDAINRYSTRTPFIPFKDNGSQLNENVNYDVYELRNKIFWISYSLYHLIL